MQTIQNTAVALVRSLLPGNAGEYASKQPGRVDLREPSPEVRDVRNRFNQPRQEARDWSLRGAYDAVRDALLAFAFSYFPTAFRGVEQVRVQVAQSPIQNEQIPADPCSSSSEDEQVPATVEGKAEPKVELRHDEVLETKEAITDIQVDNKSQKELGAVESMVPARAEEKAVLKLEPRHDKVRLSAPKTAQVEVGTWEGVQEKHEALMRDLWKEVGKDGSALLPLLSTSDQKLADTAVKDMLKVYDDAMRPLGNFGQGDRGAFDKKYANLSTLLRSLNKATEQLYTDLPDWKAAPRAKAVLKNINHMLHVIRRDALETRDFGTQEYRLFFDVSGEALCVVKALKISLLDKDNGDKCRIINTSLIRSEMGLPWPSRSSF